MGLDISLYHSENIEAYKSASREAEEVIEQIYQDYFKSIGVKEYREMTPAQNEEVKEIVKAKTEEMGCNEWGEPEGMITTIETQEPKTKPDHLFQIGYLRSSYNPGGFNSVLPQYLGEKITMYSIFEYDSEEYYFTPDWQKALENVNEAIDKLEARLGKKIYRVNQVSVGYVPVEELPATRQDALEVFNEQLEREGSLGNYSNRDGEFYLNNPMTIVASIPGKDVLGKPCTNLIYEEQRENIDFYMEGLKIIKENIEFVLSKDDPENYHLGWSA